MRSRFSNWKKLSATALIHREAWVDGRKHRKPSDDASLLAELKLQIAELPSYGYRRACALVNRLRSAQGAARVNAKRAYRVMAHAGLLLPKAPRRPQSTRVHEGQVGLNFNDGNTPTCVGKTP